MRKQLLIFLSTGLLMYVSHAQVGVGFPGLVDPSAQLELRTSSKGFLPPRVALQGTDDASQATPTIASPATGLFVYNTATAGSGVTAVSPGLYYYDGGKWQRVINQQPDATVTFDGTNPNFGASNFSGTQQSTDYVYVSNTDGTLWVWNPTAIPSAAYTTYTPPASSAWYTSIGDTDAGSNKTGSIYRTGNLGIGDFSTTAPATKLEIKSGTANTSGLRLTNLTSATPTSTGASLGVDANGNVITVPASFSSSSTGSGSLASAVAVGNGGSAELASVTINQTGIYLMSYTMRVQPNSVANNAFSVGFLSLDNSTAIAGTEMMGNYMANNGFTPIITGGSYSGTHILTVTTVPTTVYFRARVSFPDGAMTFYNDTNGRTRLSYVKVAD
jgi:hypothetical protein